MKFDQSKTLDSLKLDKDFIMKKEQIETNNLHKLREFSYLKSRNRQLWMWCVQFWICFTGHWIFLFFEHNSGFSGNFGRNIFFWAEIRRLFGFQRALIGKCILTFIIWVVLYIFCCQLWKKYESRILLLIFEVGF